MRRFIVIVLLYFPIAVLADICPKEGEKINTTPYTSTTQCHALSIVIEGVTNPEKYQECLGEVPAANEVVYYQSKLRSRRPLPSVNSLAPKGDMLLQSKVWMASKIHCQDENTITIDYWGGGNCSRCELSVRYVFNKDGTLKEAHLK